MDGLALLDQAHSQRAWRETQEGGLEVVVGGGGRSLQMIRNISDVEGRYQIDAAVLVLVLVPRPGEQRCFYIPLCFALLKS